ncbi:MAG TPA: hypothetical protein VLI07_14095, partial [Candidatus Binatus sp.]|nr:hypothetical protein [Candidatus Binatus sp.]
EIARREGRQSQPSVMLVDDAIALTDGTREVKLYHVPNNHSSGMLVGYVPDARVLFTAGRPRQRHLSPKSSLRVAGP